MIQPLEGVVASAQLKGTVRGLVKFAEIKLSQLFESEEGKEGYVYYCELCNQVLALSSHIIPMRKVSLAFDETCPSCRFSLDTLLACRASKLSTETELLVNPKCIDANCLLERRKETEVSFRKPQLPNLEPKQTLGIDALHEALELRIGDLAVWHGKASHSTASLLCVRSLLPKPRGQDSDVVFIDGGNIFDPYLISEQSTQQEIDSETVLERIHVSRAFTYHQLSHLINEKLACAIDDFKAKLVVVSDITQLYCDTDVQNKQEAFNVFRKDVRTLATLPFQKAVLIVVTNTRTRNMMMDNFLLHTARVTARLEDRNTFTELTLARHPLTPQLKATISTRRQTLESYL
jgi:hypothetical protein